MKKIFKKIVVGIIGGLLVSLFLTIFMKNILSELWETIENKTYDARYSMTYMAPQQEITAQGGVISEKRIEDVVIVNIDERSMLADNMGVYYKWPRSYHGEMFSYLKSGNNATTVFDIHFNDADYGAKESNRVYGILEKQQLSSIFKENELKRIKDIIANGVNYDREFVNYTKKSGNVIHAMILSDTNNYANKSDYIERTTEEHRLKCNPLSAARLPDTVMSMLRNYAVLDGAFPELAEAAVKIGLVNVAADKDGVHRKLPLLNRFRGYAYPAISLQTILFLCGKSLKETEIIPGNQINIGAPFYIAKDTIGKLLVSYPGVNEAMIRALIASKGKINALNERQIANICEKMVAYKDTKNRLFLDIPAGTLNFSTISDLNGVDMVALSELPLNEPTMISDATGIVRTGEEEFSIVEILNNETAIDYIPLSTLAEISRMDIRRIMQLTAGESITLTENMTVTKKEGTLTTEYIMLRGKTLEEVLELSIDDINRMKQGEKREFGKPIIIPVDQHYRMRINYLGKASKTFRTIPYYDIWAKRVPADFFTGKIFLVGSDAPSMFDIVASPVDENYPGVELHATAMADILQNKYMKDVTPAKSFIILLLLAAIAAVVSLFVKPFISLPFVILSVIAYFVYALGAFESGLNYEIIKPSFGLFGAFIFAIIYKYITEEKDKKFLKATFQNYLSAELIDQMYENRQFPELGGDEGIRTAYFTDIQGFSTFSEKLGSPTKLVELLNEYLSAMTDILMENGGTLDKYEGDAIIAFFGAPMPLSDHAYKGCLTAIRMQQRLFDLRKKWVSEGDKWPVIVHNMRMRIGVNSGPIVTGNMGSKKRMNYTMMGDTVNLAARLESAAKQYGVFTMISHFTRDMVGDAFELRELDKITVVGKSEPITVFELVAEKGKASALEMEIIGKYHEGLAMYKKQEWDKGIAIFNENAAREKEWRPDQKTNPSILYIDRCEGFKANPPGKDWDGVFKLTSK